MALSLELSELSVVIVAKLDDITVLNADFLKANQIVPASWEVEPPYISFPTAVQLAFTNGVVIRLEPGRALFIQSLVGIPVSSAVVPRIAAEVLSRLPFTEHRAVGINPKGYSAVDAEKTAREYCYNKFIVRGAWSTHFKSEPRASVKFIYPLEGGHLVLAVEDSYMNISEEKKIPVISFAANLHRDVTDDSASGRQEQALEILNGWERDIELVSSLIEKAFLKEGE